MRIYITSGAITGSQEALVDVYIPPYQHNIYRVLNRGVNKKEGAILGYFNVRHVDSATT